MTRIILFLLCACTLRTNGQGVLKIPFTEKIGPDNGLSSYNVGKILQDHFGFMWVATQDGLNRYDGIEFINYSKSSEPAHRLLGNVINDMLEDTITGLLWITSSYGGLNAINLQTGRVVHALQSNRLFKKGFQDDWLKCIALCKGQIWIGTYDGLIIYDPATGDFPAFQPLPFQKKTADDKLNISFIFEDSYHHLWINLPAFGIAVYDPDKKKLLATNNCADLAACESLNYLQFHGRLQKVTDTTALLATGHGFRLLNYDRAGKITLGDKLPAINKTFGNSYIYSCAFDAKGRLWFSTSMGVYTADVWSGQYWKVKDIAQNELVDWLKFTMYIFLDKQDNIWLGSMKGIALGKNMHAPFYPYAETGDSKIRIQHANYLFPLNDTLVYVCALDGLYLVNTFSDSIHLIDNSTAYNFCFQKEAGQLLLSSDKGLFIYRPGKKIQPAVQGYPELEPIKHDLINSAVQVGDSLFIMASEVNKGLYRWNIKQHQLQVLHLSGTGIPNNIINNLFADKEDRIWVLFDNAVGRYNARTGQFQKWQVMDPELNMPMSIFFDMCRVKDKFWMAVYGKGIVCLDSLLHVEKIIGFSEGLLNTGVYKIFPFADSLLMITSNNGLFSLHLKTGKIQRFLKSDGLNGNNFEERCGYGRGDVFYAGGIDGFTVIRPALISENENPSRTYISGIEVMSKNGASDSVNLAMDKIVIPNDAIQTKITLAGINFSNTKHTVFAYRINELSDQFVLLGNRNFITLSGLKPGTYSLEVRTSNENGKWSETKKISLVFLPRWYQSYWFFLFCAACFLGILYLLYLNRIRQLEEQQKIRRDIASDLHDDLGSSLNSVKIFTHLARQGNRPELLLQIEDSLKQAMISLRDIIWVLDDSNDSIRDFIERIKRFGLPVSMANQIQFAVVADDKVVNSTLSKKEKKNLMLIAKEGINNCFKYADCKRIDMYIGTCNNQLFFSLKDDGKGFDPALPMQGNGLKNIRYRAAQIGYAVTITAQPGAGTLIEATKNKSFRASEKMRGKDPV